MSILSEENRVYDNVLGAVGNTPLVRINRLGAHLKCELWAKCEFFNAGGSVKDRIGKRMVMEGVKEGTFKPGDTLIEPTSGNTGIGIALSGAVLGFNVVITMPKKMSLEKIGVLKALGATVIRTPTEAAFDDPDSHISVAKREKTQRKSAHIPDQYVNKHNPLAHYEGTAEEILRQCNNKIDMLVIGAGTGGTITGVGKKVKEVCPNCTVVGVDPVGSILAGPDDEGGSYHVEGIGYDFIPDVFDRSVVDKWYKSRDGDSLTVARRLIREEGLLCGGSSGTAMWAALEAAKDLKEGQRCVVVLPDSIRNYISKFVDDRWMIDFGFLEPPKHDILGTATVNDLKLDDHPLMFTPQTTCGEAMKLLAENQIDAAPVVADLKSRTLLGVVNCSSLLDFVEDKGRKDVSVKEARLPTYRHVPVTELLNRIRFSLVKNDGIVVIHEEVSSSTFSSSIT